MNPIKPHTLPFLVNLHKFGSMPLTYSGAGAQYTKELIPQLKKALNEKNLCYVFVSHFESDECGGLTEILATYPDAKVLCSEVTARQFEGFGIKINSFAQKNGDVLFLKQQPTHNDRTCVFTFKPKPRRYHKNYAVLFYKNTKLNPATPRFF